MVEKGGVAGGRGIPSRMAVVPTHLDRTGRATGRIEIESEVIDIVLNWSGVRGLDVGTGSLTLYLQ